MPDVLEMPYRPPLMDSGEPGEKKYTYRLSSCTCLAGDVIGDYSFDREIKTGDRLCFCDMAIYSMVKNNTFNGMPPQALKHQSIPLTAPLSFFTKVGPTSLAQASSDSISIYFTGKFS